MRISRNEQICWHHLNITQAKERRHDGMRREAIQALHDAALARTMIGLRNRAEREAQDAIADHRTEAQAVRMRMGE